MTIKITKAQINDICAQIDDEQIMGVKQFVMFVGHAHSGHSLIGALLDSHPQAAISNHVNVPKLLVDHQLNPQQLMKVVLYYALHNNADDSWINTGYSYQTKNGHQGTVTHPTVLGDKQGGASTRILMMHPQLITQLQDMFADKLKVVFVYRNVFDNIAAFAHYMKEDVSGKPTQRYFENLQTSLNLRQVLKKNQWFQLSHEDFIKTPQQHLKSLFDALQLDYTDDMINNSTSIVNKEPHQRRKSIQWSPTLIDYINQKMQDFDI